MIERNNQAFVAAQIESRRNGRYGSKATHSILSDHVRFTPESDRNYDLVDERKVPGNDMQARTGHRDGALLRAGQKGN
jgi:hypothetical protein